MVRKAYLRRAARPGCQMTHKARLAQDRIGWRIISRWDGIVDYHTVISLVRDKEDLPFVNTPEGTIDDGKTNWGL